MMSALYSEQGASLRIGILGEPEITDFIDTHAGILDSSFENARMSDTMRDRLKQSDWIFSGMKTFHELNEAFPSLLDENGGRKPFERFLNDVRKLDETYNRNWLNAEYNFAQASAEMAGRWEEFDDGDRYLLQYRTAGDDKVRPEHAELNGVILPKSDPFWDEYFPPNGWNCRCTVVEVLGVRNPPTDREEAFRRAKNALSNDKKGMFRFNPGKEGKSFPDYNPYTRSGCRGCTRKLKLAKGIPGNQLCDACDFVRAQAKATSDSAAKRILGYAEDRWERSYVSEKADGLVVTEKERIAEAAKYKDEMRKYRKEYGMCRVIADNGHDVEYLHGLGRTPGETFDINFDGIPADLKQVTGGAGNIVGYISDSFKRQGAKAVILELPSHDQKYYDAITEARRKTDGRILFFFADELSLKEVIKKR